MLQQLDAKGRVQVLLNIMGRQAAVMMDQQAGVFAGEATKLGFGGAFRPKCGSMRILVFAGLTDGSRRRLLLPAAGYRDSGPALGPSRPAHGAREMNGGALGGCRR